MVSHIKADEQSHLKQQERRSGYFFELFFVIIITLTLFAALTIPHLQHGIGFIFPVPLALFIIRHKVKDGIFPALFMIFCAPFITHFLPLGGGSYLRGLLIMSSAMTIGFLHGTFYKTEISHLLEIGIIIIVEFAFALLMTGVFYVVRDPVFAFDIEFPHYFSEFKRLFGLAGTSIYTQNVGKVFINMVFPYTFALAVVEVLFTHILIHFGVQYFDDHNDHRPFTGLVFKLPRITGHIYLGLVILCGVSFVFMKNPLDDTQMNIIIGLFFITVSLTIVFILQGVLVAIYYMRFKHHYEATVAIFLIALFFSLPAAILGALNVIFKWSDKLMLKYGEASPKHTQSI